MSCSQCDSCCPTCCMCHAEGAERIDALQHQLATVTADRDRLLAEVARLRPVYDAAVRWYWTPDLRAADASLQLAHAIQNALDKERHAASPTLSIEPERKA